MESRPKMKKKTQIREGDAEVGKHSERFGRLGLFLVWAVHSPFSEDALAAKLLCLHTPHIPLQTTHLATAGPHLLRAPHTPLSDCGIGFSSLKNNQTWKVSTKNILNASGWEEWKGWAIWPELVWGSGVRQIMSSKCAFRKDPPLTIPCVHTIGSYTI